MIAKKIKRFSIATLGVCCFLTAGLGLKAANAAAEPISVTSLVSTTAETSVSAEGLSMQSVDAYEGQIMGVFEMGTNLALDFTWQEETAFYLGNFVIRITDAANPNNYFDVAWNNNSYQNKWSAQQLEDAGLTGVYTTSDVRYTTGLAHVQWGDEIRSANPTNNASSNTTAQQSYPYFTRDMSIQKDGTLQLVWEKDANGEDILIVTVAGNNSGNKSHRIRAIFDGTYDAMAADKGFVYDSETPTNNQWGLPYLDFSNGYTLSFYSSFSSTKTTDKSTDVVFKKLTLGGTAKYTYLPNTNNTKYKTCTLSGGTEYDLTTANIDAPSFYETYQTYPFITVEEHSSFDNVRKGEKIVIPGATWVSATSSTSQPVQKIYVAYDGTETQVSAGDEYTLSQAGTYTLIYETSGRRLKETFTAVDYKTIAAKDIVTVEGTSGGIGVDIAGNGGYLVSAEKGVAYSGEILGNFYGDARLKFNFPRQFTDKKDVAGAKFVYSVCDLQGNEVLSVVYLTSGTWTNCYVQYGKEVRTYGYGKASAWGNHYWYKEVTSENALFAPYLSCGGGKRDTAAPGELAFVWDGDVFQVVANYYHESSGRDKMVTIAAFDGSDRGFEKPALGYVAEADFAAWGLPKLDNLKDGYKIKFSCDNFVADIPLNIIEINGIKPYAKNYLDTNYTFEAVFDKALNVSGDNVYIPQGVEFPDVYGVYSIMLTDSWGFKTTEKVAASVDTSSIGVKTLVVSSSTYADDWKTIEKSYTVNVEKANTITFETNGGKSIAPIVYSENTLSRIRILPAERVFWVFDGWYEDADLTTAFDGTASVLVGRDVTLYAKWHDVDAPIIRLQDNVKETDVGIKSTKTIVSNDDVVAEDAAQNDTVQVSIEVKAPNGEFVSVASGYELLFNQSGEYVIRYTATDAAGWTDTIIRKIVVIEKACPVVTIQGEMITFGLVGETIALANATAIDADGNTLTVSVTVLLNNNEVELTDNAFTPTEAGQYTVIFVAEDETGLFGSYEYVVTVEKDEVAPIIITDFTDCTVENGETVVVPQVSVEDNSQNTRLEIAVWYGTEEVALVNGAFKAEKSGVYSVVIRAFDAAGNVSEKIVQVSVAVQESGSACDEESGCVIAASASGVVGVAACVSVILIIKKKKKKEGKDNGEKND